MAHGVELSAIDGLVAPLAGPPRQPKRPRASKWQRIMNGGGCSSRLVNLESTVVRVTERRRTDAIVTPDALEHSISVYGSDLPDDRSIADTEDAVSLWWANGVGTHSPRNVRPGTFDRSRTGPRLSLDRAGQEYHEEWHSNAAADDETLMGYRKLE